jgi:protein gp37
MREGIVSGETGIEWTDTTWNPVVGCSVVSPGCEHCYAARMDHRLRGIAGEEWKPWTAPNAAYNVRLHPERLTAPLHWRKPRRVFVNSMSDLFHEQVPDEFIDRVFAVMALTPQHTYQVLTKRPERMREYLTSPRHGEPVETFVELEKDRISTEAWGLGQFLGAWPLPNVWLGVSCEDQRRADERIPLLLQTPAAVRFISAEPLLGPIDLRTGVYAKLGTGTKPNSTVMEGWSGTTLEGLDWVIVGGESGPGARPCDEGWVFDIVQQCRAAGVAAFVKQLGTNSGWSLGGVWVATHRKDRKGGNPSEWPEDLRHREFPRPLAVSR